MQQLKSSCEKNTEIAGCEKNNNFWGSKLMNNKQTFLAMLNQMDQRVF